MKTAILLTTVLLGASAATNVAWAQNDQAKTVKPGQESVLDLEGYLNQVRKGSQLFTASQMSSDAAEMRAHESDLLTRPNLIAGGSYGRSKAQTGSPFSGDDNTQTAYSLGVQETTDFGLSAALKYNLNSATSNADLSSFGAAASTFSTNYSTSGPQLTLTGSLWRNWFGQEIRANQEQINAAALAQKYNQSFAQTQILAQAETAYWALALSREQVASSKEVLALTEKSQKWSANRQRLELTDKSDLLQANAALFQRRLALQTALDSEKSASRTFNTIRGVDADLVSENLNSFEPTVIERLQIPNRVQFRDDVKAAEQGKRAAQAAAKLGIARNTPTVDVTGIIGLNGRDATSSQAISNGFTTDRPNYAIGLQASIPLDFSQISRDKSAYNKEVDAADTLYKRRMFESERLWHDLTTLFTDAVGRYRLAADLEKANKEKVTYERYRHDRGRSTLYQVILFENDYAESQISRIRAQADVLTAYAQLRTFGGGQ